MSIGALLTAVVMLVIAGLVAFKSEKPAMAVPPALIGGIALLIAFPQLLMKGTAVPVALLIGAGGVIGMLIGVISHKMRFLVLLGAVVAIWGLFRAFPHVDNAFFAFGKNMSGSLDQFWAGIKGTGTAIAKLFGDLAG